MLNLSSAFFYAMIIGSLLSGFSSSVNHRLGHTYFHKLLDYVSLSFSLLCFKSSLSPTSLAVPRCLSPEAFKRACFVCLIYLPASDIHLHFPDT